MILDLKKLAENEAYSNPMVAAMQYLDCPDKRSVCFGLTVGFGTPNNECEYLKSHQDSLECTFKEGQVQP